MTDSHQRSRPAWQLPPGISRGTWDYLQTPSIAEDYDAYFREHPLLKLDLEIVRRFLPAVGSAARPVIADFGCGTARVATEFAPLGYRMLNVDLSRHMLREAIKANSALPRYSACVQANLVQLEWLRDSSLDMAVCLFSSIGMIRGRQHRRQFLSHVHRALRTNSVLVLHVHNRLRSLLDPGGPLWLLKTRLSSWTNGDSEYGDRVYAYRGLPAMFLHIYSRRELMQDVTAAGFKKLEILPVNSTSSELLKSNSAFSTITAGGYFAIATK